MLEIILSKNIEINNIYVVWEIFNKRKRSLMTKINFPGLKKIPVLFGTNKKYSSRI